MLYNNALTTLTRFATPDPFVVNAHNRFYLTYTADGRRIELLTSDSLTGLRQARPNVIWRPPPNLEYSRDVWAPELHALDGRWYIYFAADHPAVGNKSHRIFVLGGPPADHSPTVGPWEFLGRLRGLPEDQFAIDGTVFDLKGSRYFVYSGWPLGEHESDLNQELFIVKLDNPRQARGAPVCLSTPDNLWERTIDSNGDHGINEGPQFLAAPSGAWCGLVYSCAASWSCDYKYGLLHFDGGDVLSAASWRKDTKPLLRSDNNGRGPYGPGHGNFVHLSDGSYAVFHATDKPDEGWANRRARLQQLMWTSHGPFMGEFVGKEVDYADTEK